MSCCSQQKDWMSEVSKETTNASKFMYIFSWQGENENHSAIVCALN